MEAIEQVKASLDQFLVSRPDYLDYVNTFKANVNQYNVDHLIEFNEYGSVELSNFRMVNLFLMYLKDSPQGQGYERLAEMFIRASKEFPGAKVLTPVKSWYVGGLCKEIDNFKELKEILSIVKIYKQLLGEGLDMSSLKTALSLKITTLTWDLIEAVPATLENSSYLDSLEALSLVQHPDFELESTLYSLFDSIQRYLQKRYNFYKFPGRESDPNTADGVKLVTKLKKLELKDEFQIRQLEELKEFFGCAYEERDEEPDNGVFVRPEWLESKQIDFNDIKTEKPIYTNVSNPNLSIYIYLARSYTLGEVALKIYQATSVEFLKNVQNEIDILEFLSQYANENNCFTKFYGKYADNNVVYLAMEYHPRTLMKMISELKSQGTKLGDDYIQLYTYTLLDSFAFMENLNIFHQDIKPHNILVTNNWRLKIIDFSISHKKETIDAQTLITGVMEVQGTKGYMAPELEDSLNKSEKTARFRRNKADVFSLGMTLLQMYSFEDLYTLNLRDNNGRLMEKVRAVHIPWLRTLLEKMLRVEYNQRPSFKECLQFVPGSDATHAN